MQRALRWYDTLTVNVYFLGLTTLSQTNGLVFPLLVQQLRSLPHRSLAARGQERAVTLEVGGLSETVQVMASEIALAVATATQTATATSTCSTRGTSWSSPRASSPHCRCEKRLRQRCEAGGGWRLPRVERELHRRRETVPVAVLGRTNRGPRRVTCPMAIRHRSPFLGGPPRQWVAESQACCPQT